MQKIILIIIFISVAFQSYAQFINADYNKAEEIMQRPVIVSLFDMEEEAGNYCDSTQMAWYNENIRKLFPQYWTLSDSIIFMRSQRVSSIIAAKENDYVIFSAGPSREGQQSSSEVFWFPSFTFMIYLSEDGKQFGRKFVDRSLYSRPMTPDDEMTGQLFRGKYIYKLSFADLALAESDLIFAITQTEAAIITSLAQRKANGGIYAKRVPKYISYMLKEKTLLIPNDLDADIDIDQKVIAKYYKHPFRIASQEEIDEAIASKAENTAYLHYLWSDHDRMFVGMLIDAQSGMVLAALGPGIAKLNKADCLGTGISYRILLRMKVNKLKSLSKLAK
jgi:hypothetical protein